MSKGYTTNYCKRMLAYETAEQACKFRPNHLHPLGVKSQRSWTDCIFDFAECLVKDLMKGMTTTSPSTSSVFDLEDNVTPTPYSESPQGGSQEFNWGYWGPITGGSVVGVLIIVGFGCYMWYSHLKGSKTLGTESFTRANEVELGKLTEPSSAPEHISDDNLQYIIVGDVNEGVYV